MPQTFFSHPFSVAESRRIADQAFAFYQQQYAYYQPTLEWKTDNEAQLGFMTNGIRLSARVWLEPKLIRLEVAVPWFLRVFEKKALERVREELNRWFSGD